MAGKWVSDEVRAMAAPDQYGRTWPFAVYVQMPRGELVTRNLNLADAEALADREAAEGRRVTVSVDTCG